MRSLVLALKELWGYPFIYADLIPNPFDLFAFPAFALRLVRTLGFGLMSGCEDADGGVTRAGEAVGGR